MIVSVDERSVRDCRFDVGPPLLRTVAAMGLKTSLDSWPDEPLGDSSWSELRSAADGQRMWTFVAAAVSQGVLPATEDQRSEAFAKDEAAVLACLHLDRVLLEVWRPLRAAAIDARVFKGVASALLAYPAPGRRTYSDVDLLVPGHQFSTATTILEGLGGRRQNPDPRDGFTASLGKSASFTLPGGWEIDLHRSPQGGPFGAAVRTDELFESVTELAIGGDVVETLSAEHLFITACYHGVLPRDPRRLVPLLDVARMLDADRFDADEVQEIAGRWSGSIVVAEAVRIATELFGLAPETTMHRWARELRPPKREQVWLRACRSSEPRAALLVGLLNAAAFPSPMDGARFLRAQVFHAESRPVGVRVRSLARRLALTERRPQATSLRPADARGTGSTSVLPRMVVVSHTPHYRRDGAVVGFGPTVREVDQLAALCSELVHIAPLHDEAAPDSALPICATNVTYLPVPATGGGTLVERARALGAVPSWARTMNRAFSGADIAHVRLPAGIAVVALVVLAFRRRPAKRWFKFAGNWQPPASSGGSYWFQRWWLRHDLSRGEVTVNGRWPDQPVWVHTFENPTLTSEEVEVGRRAAAQKADAPPFRVAFVGRVEEAKGAALVVEVMEKLVQDGFDVIADLVGDGPIRSDLEERSRTLGLDQRVVFHGWLDRRGVEAVLADAHVLLLPSYAPEGFPKVLAEAMAFGALPVTSRVSGIGQFFDEIGLACSFDDPTSAMVTELLGELFADPAEMERRRTIGLAHVDRFTYARHLERVAGLLGLEEAGGDAST